VLTRTTITRLRQMNLKSSLDESRTPVGGDNGLFATTIFAARTPRRSTEGFPPMAKDSETAWTIRTSIRIESHRACSWKLKPRSGASRHAATSMSNESVIFLNRLQVAHGNILGRPLPPAYILACKFLHCGIIDRTRALDQGFNYAVLDQPPSPVSVCPSFAELCDTIADEIVSAAVQNRRNIAVLWSGGIDSTAALIALMKVVEKQGRHQLLRILLTQHSVQEYPQFYLRYVKGRYAQVAVTPPIAECLNPGYLNVTGEHGDQLFGSQLLAPYVQEGVSHRRYDAMLPEVVFDALQNATRTDRVVRYLEPVIERAPVRIRTLFDCLWWLNFSLKWQHVTLRLAALRKEQARNVYLSLRHFFRDERFQQWSLVHHPARGVSKWARYKDAAKEYIRAFTGDEQYYLHKQKEPSLGNVMKNANGVRPRLCIFMREDFCPVTSVFEKRSPEKSYSARSGGV